MTREDIIEMWKRSGGVEIVGMPFSKIEAFAALVIKPWADQLEVERKKFQELNDIAVVGMQHARIAEREACAKVCEDLDAWNMDDPASTAAEAIRARGQA